MKTDLVYSVLVASAFVTRLACCSDASALPPNPTQAMMQAIQQASIDMATKYADSQPPDPASLAAELQKNLNQNAAGIKLPAAEKLMPLSSDEVEKLARNVNGLKELFERAEAAMKTEHFRDAWLAYQSVSYATAPGAEDIAARSRDRLIELESIARTRLKLAGDKDGRQDFTGEAADLDFLIRELPDTVSGKSAAQHLISLRSRPAAAAFLDLEQAKGLLQQGKMAAAVEQFNAIAANPRYQNTVAALEAAREASELSSNPVIRKVIEADNAEKAERAAHALLANARNLMLSHMPTKAAEKLNELLALHPEAPSATEARKLLDTIK